MEELAKRVKKKDEGVIRHFHLYHHHCASVTSAFRISVGYVARRSERRFDKRMDRYMYERTTAVKEKVNVGKKREAREKKQREERGEQWRTKKTEHTRTYTRAATVSTKTKRNEGRGEEG